MDTKTCPRCKRELPKTEYSKSKSRKDGLQAYCRECHNKYTKEHYAKNREQYFKRSAKQRKSLREWVHQYKDAHFCVDCNISYPGEPWLMEFDHLDAEGKESNIADLIRNGSLRRLEKEVSKCELLCLVCHRRRTARRGKWIAWKV